MPILINLIIGFFFVAVNNGFADDPYSERARAYIDTNKLKIAVENYGVFTGSAFPQGLWGDFHYISNFSLIAGIPGLDRNGNPYPWAIGKKQKYNKSINSFEETGMDSTFWGATVSDSWSSPTNFIKNTDWEAVENSKKELHNPNATAGAYFGSVGLYTSLEDSCPLIAISSLPETWPIINGKKEWPGHWALDPKDPMESRELKGTLVSDQDIYYKLDDRFASRDIDTTQGYSIGFEIEVSGFAFADTSAEDIVFFKMIITNKSDYHYEGVYLGMYLDVDSYSRQANGSYAGRSNSDDMADYNKEYGFAYIYDLDGDPDNIYVGDKILAYTAAMFLETPVSSDSIDLNVDGVLDIYPGDRLGLTSWHWFDWHFRPGLRDDAPNHGWEYGFNSTINKEEIQYKILAGDTSNLKSYDSLNHFHSNPDNGQLNPRFDSVENLKLQYPDGLDCVFIMATGPFSLNSGSSVPVSVCLFMGKNENDLIRNALTAQDIYKRDLQISHPIDNNPERTNPSDYIIYQNYPNPFNSGTTINYLIRKPGNVRINIFNTLGQKVATILDTYKQVGKYQVEYHPQTLSSGIYFYQIEINEFRQTKRMLYIK